MRDIKFRGKIKNDPSYRPTDFGKGVWVVGLMGRRPCIDKIYAYKFYINTGEYEFEVDPDTVGQFTGLLDKNGKEIYEDDIVEWQQYGFTGQKTDTTIKGVVYFDTDCGAYGLNTGFVKDFTRLIIFYKKVDLGDIAVIGNIHDNKKLLKSTKLNKF